jgi:hypothetical protein
MASFRCRLSKSISEGEAVYLIIAIVHIPFDPGPAGAGQRVRAFKVLRAKKVLHVEPTRSGGSSAPDRVVEPETSGGARAVSHANYRLKVRAARGKFWHRALRSTTIVS